MKREKPIYGHCFRCLIKLFLKPYLVFQKDQVVPFFSLIEFEL